MSDSNVGFKIKEIRLAQKMTLKELAEKTDLSDRIYGNRQKHHFKLPAPAVRPSENRDGRADRPGTGNEHS